MFDDSYKKRITDSNFEKLPAEFKKRFDVNHKLHMGRVDKILPTTAAACHCNSAQSTSSSAVPSSSSSNPAYCRSNCSCSSSSSTKEMNTEQPKVSSKESVQPKVPSKETKVEQDARSNIKKFVGRKTAQNEAHTAVQHNIVTNTLVKVGKNAERILKHRAYELNFSDLKVELFSCPLHYNSLVPYY